MIKDILALIPFSLTAVGFPIVIYYRTDDVEITLLYMVGFFIISLSLIMVNFVDNKKGNYKKTNNFSFFNKVVPTVYDENGNIIPPQAPVNNTTPIFSKTIQQDFNSPTTMTVNTPIGKSLNDEIERISSELKKEYEGVTDMNLIGIKAYCSKCKAMQSIINAEMGGYNNTTLKGRCSVCDNKIHAIIKKK